MTGANGGTGPGDRPGWRWDVALSFAGAQRDYVEQVAQALRARGVRCFYDADEQIELWGKYLAEELPAIYGEQAATVVVFVSAEYAARDYTRLERRAALDRAVRERREYVLPARFDDTSLPGLLSGMVAVDLHGRTPQQFAAMIVAKLTALAVTPPSADGGDRAGFAPQALSGTNVFNLLPPAAWVGDAGERPTVAAGDMVTPPRGRLPQSVRGRADLLAELDRAVKERSSSVQVLSGAGGVGKSAVALALAVQERWSDVWWISSGDEVSLRAGLISVARKLRAGQQDVLALGSGSADGPDRVWMLLEQAREGWLLVFDNADEPQLLAAPVPAGSGQASRLVADGTGWVRPTRRGTVVVTSRDANPAVWGRQAQVHRLGPLAEQDATQVLLDLAPLAGTEAEAQQLARRLGSLPLALQLAGAAIGSPYGRWASFADYRRALEKTGLGTLDPEPDSAEASDRRAVITRTWELSLDALAHHGRPQARPVLRLLSCYAAAVPIPERLLSGPAMTDLLTGYGADDRAHDRDEQEAAERALAVGLGGLARVGLIDLETAADDPGAQRWIVVHRLVVDASQLNLDTLASPGQARAIRRTAVRLLAAAVGELVADHPADWKAWGILVPHVFSLLDTSASAVDPGDLDALLTAAASAIDFLDWSGATQAGYDLGRAAVARSTRLVPEDPALLHLRSRFACAIGALGRWDEAEVEYRQVLRGRKEVLGDDHPDTLMTRHELARAVGEQERWKEAEAGFRAVLRARRELLGDDHPDTLTTRHALAYAVGAQGHWDQAEPEFREVLAARIRLLGEMNFHTLITRNELAHVLAKQGRWQDAEAMYREVLATRRKVLGEESRGTLETWHALADTIARQGRRDEAIAEYRKVFAAEARILGKNDPATMAAGQALQELTSTAAPDGPLA